MIFGPPGIGSSRYEARLLGTTDATSSVPQIIDWTCAEGLTWVLVDLVSVSGRPWTATLTYRRGQGPARSVQLTTSNLMTICLCCRSLQVGGQNLAVVGAGAENNVGVRVQPIDYPIGSPTAWTYIPLDWPSGAGLDETVTIPNGAVSWRVDLGPTNLEQLPTAYVDAAYVVNAGLQARARIPVLNNSTGVVPVAGASALIFAAGATGDASARPSRIGFEIAL